MEPDLKEVRAESSSKPRSLMMESQSMLRRACSSNSGTEGSDWTAAVVVVSDVVRDGFSVAGVGLPRSSRTEVGS